MITIEFQNDRRCEVFDSGESIGYVSVSRNAFHARNRYLELELTQYDPANAKELFAVLRSELSHPLQAMLDAHEYEKRGFLVSGGFRENAGAMRWKSGRKTW